MTPDDLPRVIALADRVHPTFPEGEAMYRDRMALFGAGCMVLAAGEAIGGYAVAYPARDGAPPPLDTVLGALPANADTLYIHDVALAPEARGAGRSDEAVHRLLALAAPLRRAMLVSVYGTAPFWRRFGFREVEAAPGKLESYGADAVMMAWIAADLPSDMAGS